MAKISIRLLVLDDDLPHMRGALLAGFKTYAPNAEFGTKFPLIQKHESCSFSLPNRDGAPAIDLQLRINPKSVNSAGKVKALIDSGGLDGVYNAIIIDDSWGETSESENESGHHEIVEALLNRECFQRRGLMYLFFSQNFVFEGAERPRVNDVQLLVNRLSSEYGITGEYLGKDQPREFKQWFHRVVANSKMPNDKTEAGSSERMEIHVKRLNEIWFKGAIYDNNTEREALIIFFCLVAGNVSIRAVRDLKIAAKYFMGEPLDGGERLDAEIMSKIDSIALRSPGNERSGTIREVIKARHTSFSVDRLNFSTALNALKSELVARGLPVFDVGKKAPGSIADRIRVKLQG